MSLVLLPYMIVIDLSYCQQNNKFAEIILIDHLYLKRDEISKLLKYAFANDEHISLKQATTAIQYLNVYHKFLKKNIR